MLYVININILSNNTVLSTLKLYQTNLGYYTYNTTKEGVYNIDGKDTLLYISPREILSNETRTYKNKTYEYTHETYTHIIQNKPPLNLNINYTTTTKLPS